MKISYKVSVNYEAFKSTPKVNIEVYVITYLR